MAQVLPFTLDHDLNAKLEMQCEVIFSGVSRSSVHKPNHNNPCSDRKHECDCERYKSFDEYHGAPAKGYSE